MKPIPTDFILSNGPINFQLTEDVIDFKLNAIVEYGETFFRLLEDGDYRLLEDGDKRLLE